MLDTKHIRNNLITLFSAFNGTNPATQYILRRNIARRIRTLITGEDYVIKDSVVVHKPEITTNEEWVHLDTLLYKFCSPNPVNENINLLLEIYLVYLDKFVIPFSKTRPINSEFSRDTVNKLLTILYKLYSLKDKEDELDMYSLESVVVMILYIYRNGGILQENFDVIKNLFNGEHGKVESLDEYFIDNNGYVDYYDREQNANSEVVISGIMGMLPKTDDEITVGYAKVFWEWIHLYKWDKSRINKEFDGLSHLRKCLQELNR